MPRLPLRKSRGSIQPLAFEQPQGAGGGSHIVQLGPPPQPHVDGLFLPSRQASRRCPGRAQAPIQAAREAGNVSARRSARRSCNPSNRCPYTFRVVPMEAWPHSSWISFGCAPAARAQLHTRFRPPTAPESTWPVGSHALPLVEDLQVHRTAPPVETSWSDSSSCSRLASSTPSHVRRPTCVILSQTHS
jgi:hypothetical protein